MSSHSIRLSKAMRQLQNIRNIQKASVNKEDPYTVGMFNGIELALSIITDREPDYVECSKTINSEPQLLEPVCSQI